MDTMRFELMASSLQRRRSTPELRALKGATEPATAGVKRMGQASLGGIETKGVQALKPLFCDSELSLILTVVPASRSVYLKEKQLGESLSFRVFEIFISEIVDFKRDLSLEPGVYPPGSLMDRDMVPTD